jgi:hypothetical protein
MVDLEKKISGDWIELKEALNDIHSLLDFLAVLPAQLAEASARLRLSVEQGIIEYKRTCLSPVLVALETARYKSLGVEEILAQEKALTLLLFTVLVQRLLASEQLPLTRRAEDRKSFGVEDMQVNVILADLKARVKGNPALRADPAFKNVLMQVQLYNRENQKMRELLPTIKPEMQTSFLANFTRTFDDIIGSIRRNYLSILVAEAEAKKARQQGFSLALMPLKELAPFLTNQAREVARMRSTLAYAREEKYKTREVLVSLYESRHDILRLVEDEVKLYRRMCQMAHQWDLDACSVVAANGFRDEVIGILEKQAKRDPKV